MQPTAPSDDEAPLRMEALGSALTDTAIPERRLARWLRLAFVALLAVGGFGLYLALENRDDDALREIGGALVSGSVVGMAVLTFEELAERRRQLRQDQRDGERDLEAGEREHAQVIRADELAIWSKLNDICHRQLSPAIRGKGYAMMPGQPVGELVPSVKTAVAHDALDELHVVVRDELMPLARQVLGAQRLERLHQLGETFPVLYENDEGDDFLVPRSQDDQYWNLKVLDQALDDFTKEIAAEYRKARLAPLLVPHFWES